MSSKPCGKREGDRPTRWMKTRAQAAQTGRHPSFNELERRGDQFTTSVSRPPRGKLRLGHRSNLPTAEVLFGPGALRDMKEALSTAVVGYHGMSGYGLAGSGNAGERGESEATMNTSKNGPSMSTRTLSAIVGMFASRRMLGCLRATFPRPVGRRRLSCVSFRKSRADLTLVSPVESGDFVWRWM